MKNLKKVLALVVALTMVLGTVGFAAYTDVAEDAGEYTAVSTLSSLGILTGYEDGSFKPDGDITRAEFATVVCRALAVKASGSAVTGFTDVPADHWASAYIAYCAGAGIVNGMGDGTFAPSANVTVEQAVKMLVVALGYEPMAAAKGGYPTGYMVVANTNGITEGVATAQTAPATRADVAKLVFNALDVPMMVQDGFGTQISYKVADGKSGNPAYQSLLSNLDVAKLDGTVVATSKIEFNGNKADVGKVTFDIAADGIYDTANFTYKDVDDYVVAEGVNAEDYFQLDTTIYVRELSKGKYEIIAAMPGDDSEVVELDYEVLEDAIATKITYNESDSSNDEEDLNINSGATWYWNYSSDKTADSAAADLKDLIDNGLDNATDLNVTVIENNGLKGYDAVIVKVYEYDRVSEIEAEKDRFYATFETAAFKFDFDDEEKDITIVDKNGEAMELADFAEDDVIAFMHDKTLSDYTWIEVINYGQNVVTGAVKEAKNDGTVYIDGTEYINVSGDTINLGDEGTFFLTASGKIFSHEISASVAGNYGYILAAAWTDANGWDEAWQIKILTKDNEIVTYVAKDGVAIEHVTMSDAGVASTDSAAAYFNAVKSEDGFAANPMDRLVTFKTNSKGEITEIAQADKTATSAAGTYNAGTGKLFGKYVEDAVVFNIDVTKAASAFVTNAASFVDDNDYEGYAIKNVNGDVDCFLITEGGSEIDYTQPLAVVANVTTTNIDSTEALKVSYYVGGEGELKEIIIMDDTDVSSPISSSDGANEIVDTTVYDKVKQGAIMMFSDNGNGVASAYAVLANVAYNAANSAASVEATNTQLINLINNDADLETKIYVTSIDTYERKNGINITFAAPVGELALERGTACYTIDNAREARKAKITVGDWQATGVDKKDGSKANMAIIRVVDDSLVDLITLSAR